MKRSQKITAILTSGALQFLTIPALAQSGAPVDEPPTVTQPSSGISLTESTNSTRKSSGSGTTREFRFSAVDTDSDGLISLAEFAAHMNANQPRSAAGDVPQTGISAVEMLFNQMDRNSDKFLSEAEVADYQEQADTNGFPR